MSTEQCEPRGIPTVTIIVPIYNVQKYLAQCLESILGQTLPDIEVLCINDGSTDDSPQIAQSYADQDARVRVINKPNAGYGHSVNLGIREARAPWIAIVEPDDFIDSRMLQDLVENSRLADGSAADIVKSSFWEYHDFDPSGKPRITRPFLATCMPPFRIETDVYRNPDLIRQHPSIWSALYRRDFILESGIRMLEVPGAGWTDNPWLFDTMLRARSVVWLPSAYYYYRKENPDGSSNLKDFHLPFDRLRDMRRIVDELNVTDHKILWALYSRTLTYITKIILDEGGFEESDPELQSLIAEVLDSMDPDVLFERGNLISEASKNYYRDFMGRRLSKVKPRVRRNAPFASYVLPLQNDRKALWPTLESLMLQTDTDFEVICIDCGNTDRSRSIVEAVQQRDSRFVLAPVQADNATQGFKMGLSLAKGAYTGFLRSGVALDADFTARCRELAHEHSDGGPLAIVVEQSLAHLRPSRMGKAPASLVASGAVASCPFAFASPDAYGKLFPTSELLAQLPQQGNYLDEDGALLAAFVLAAGWKTVFASGPSPDRSARFPLRASRERSAADAQAALRQTLDALAEANAAEPRQAQYFKDCMLHVLACELEQCLRGPDALKRAAAVLNIFNHDYGIRAQSPASWANYEDFAQLAAAATLEPGQLLEQAAEQERQRAAAERRRAAKAEHSSGFKAEKAAKSALKRILPKQAIAAWDKR